MKQAPVNIKNKRATFDYELTDTYTAGIVLTGTEIKSIRLGKASLVDTFCYFAERRIVGEEHACGRILLWFVQQSQCTQGAQAFVE